MKNIKVATAVLLPSLMAVVCSLGPGCGGTDGSVGGSGNDDGGSDSTTANDSGNTGNDASNDSGGGSDSGSDSGNDAGNPPACGMACTEFADGGAFPALDRACTITDNCSLVLLHRVDSCGTVIAVSYNHAETVTFGADETAWDTDCTGGVGDAGPTYAEDGKAVPPDGGVQRKCDNPDAGVGAGLCTTFVP
jgi:hypothetical protein